METKSLKDAVGEVAEEIKAVWLHHLGPKLIMGKEYGQEDNPMTNEKLKIIKSDQKVAEKVLELYKTWRNLEYESRRPNRAAKSQFIEKQKR